MNNKPGFFPMFMDIREKKIVFIGGGKIATRRAKVLSGFDANITLIAPETTDELNELISTNQVTHINSLYGKNQTEDDALLKQSDIVFACTDDEELNHRIYLKCKEYGKLVNNCSNHNECDFYFPGIVQKENVVVGVNAGGKAHSQAKEIRAKIEDILK